VSTKNPDDTDRVDLNIKGRTLEESPEQYETKTFNAAGGGQRVFPARLTLGLTVTIDGSPFVIKPGDVKSFDLHMTSWGWDGQLEFIVVDDKTVGGPEQDKMREKFIGPKLIEVSLDVASAYSNNAPTLRPAVTLKGIGHERSVQEIQQQNELADNGISMRRYSLRVTDPMRGLWGQHFPSVLYADKTMKSVFDEHKGDKINLAYDFPPLDETRPIIFVGLDPANGVSSFYDYVMWFVDRNNGVLTYDIASNTYNIRAAKKDVGGPYDLYWQDIERSTHKLPAVPRYTPQILNSYTERPVTQPITNPQSATTMVRSTLLRTAVDQEVTKRKALETTRLITEPQPTLELQFKSFPAAPLFPNDLAQVQTGKFAWHQKSWAVQQKDFRVIDVKLQGHTIGGERFDHGGDAGRYSTSYQVHMELKADKKSRLPEFIEQQTPTYVEGKIVSEVGADDEKTHEPFPADPQPRAYHVLVPLWNQKIIAPYEPLKLPGQLHFPAYKHQRVLMAFTWRRSWVDSFLDWREGIERPTDAQANHMLLGKKPDSITSILHDYESNIPVFTIARTHMNDLQTVRISEGNLHIEVKEDPNALPGSK